MLSGCDFLRKVAGRPTSQELQEKYTRHIERQKAIEDSIRVERELQEKLARELLYRQAGVERLDSMGVKVSSVFSYGTPINEIRDRFTVIAGVFKTKSKSDELMATMMKRGYEPYFLNFEGGVRALALMGDDDIHHLADRIQSGFDSAKCPRQIWIYEKTAE